MGGKAVGAVLVVGSVLVETDGGESGMIVIFFKVEGCCGASNTKPEITPK